MKMRNGIWDWQAQPGRLVEVRHLPSVPELSRACV